jgi:hypothetical protein
MDDNWIKVEDRLPEPTEANRVLIYNYYAYTAWFSEGKFYHVLGDMTNNKPMKDVTHWMPLPNPPKV